MEWATAILGMAIGALFGWSLAGWLEGRNQAEIRRFYDDLDEIRRQRWAAVDQASTLLDEVQHSLDEQRRRHLGGGL